MVCYDCMPWPYCPSGYADGCLVELENYTWAITGRGETYRRMGKYERALADLDRAIELIPDNAGV